MSSQQQYLFSSTGMSDIITSFRRWPLWLILGWYDFQLKYRRTVVGPLWLMLQMAIWIIGLSLIFGRPLHGENSSVIPYIACGVILWQFIAATFSDGAQIFVQRASMIRSLNIPLASFVLRRVVYNTLKLCVQFLIFPIVLAFSSIPLSPVMLMALPGMLALILTSVWAVMVMGLIGARFPDTTHLVASGMRFLFFISPVFWMPQNMPGREYIAYLNPLTYFLEIVRAPLLGGMPSLLAWSIVIGFLVVGWTAAVLAFCHFRRSLVFWL